MGIYAITGASSGIGAKTKELLIQQGHKVINIDLKDGDICVASSDHPKGTVVQTSLGAGKVYDTGCPSGTIDIYTDW